MDRIKQSRFGLCDTRPRVPNKTDRGLTEAQIAAEWLQKDNIGPANQGLGCATRTRVLRTEQVKVWVVRHAPACSEQSRSRFDGSPDRRRMVQELQLGPKSVQETQGGSESVQEAQIGPESVQESSDWPRIGPRSPDWARIGPGNPDWSKIGPGTPNCFTICPGTTD